MAHFGIAGHHNILLRILLIGLADLHPLARLYDTLGVGNAGTHFNKDGRVERLGKFVCQFGKSQCLGRIGRLQHRDLRGLGIMAGILLVLRRVHTCIVRHANDHTRIHTGIGNGKQRVRRHIEAHMLHSAETALSRKAGAEGGFHSHFFIGGPLRINLFIGGYALGDLGTGCAGITGHKTAASLKQASGNRFVAKHQCFHNFFSYRSNDFKTGNQPVIWDSTKRP